MPLERIGSIKMKLNSHIFLHTHNLLTCTTSEWRYQKFFEDVHLDANIYWRSATSQWNSRILIMLVYVWEDLSPNKAIQHSAVFVVQVIESYNSLLLWSCYILTIYQRQSISNLIPRILQIMAIPSIHAPWAWITKVTRLSTQPPTALAWKIPF